MNQFTLWNTDTGQPVASWRGAGFSTRVAGFSPDGRLVVTPADGKGDALQMHTVDDGKAIGEPMVCDLTSSIWSPLFSPDGKYLLLGLTQPSLWETATGKRIGQLPVPLAYDGARFSPDGATLLTRSHNKGAQLRKSATLEPIGEPLRHADELSDGGFQADGKAVWTASKQESRAWDPATGKPLGEPLPHPPGVAWVAFGPGLRSVLFALQGNRFVALDLTSRRGAYEPIEAPGIVGNTGLGTGLVFNTLPWRLNGLVQSSRDKNVGVILDAAADNPLGKEFPLDFWSRPLGLNGGRNVLFGVSPDRGCFFVQNDPQSLQLRDADGTALGEPVREEGVLLAAGFGPDSKTLWTESAAAQPGARTFRLRRVAGGKVVLGPENLAGSPLGFTPDGKKLLIEAALKDKFEIVFRNTTTGEVEGGPLTAPAWVGALAFAPDGGRFAAANGANVWLWEAASGKVSAGPLAHPSPVGGLAFGPDGRVLLTWSGNRVWLWEAATGKLIGAPVDHTAPINAAVSRPDGDAVVVGNRTGRQQSIGMLSKGELAVLDTRTGKTLGKLVQDNGVQDLCFRPDGRYLATLDLRGTMRLWRAGSWDNTATSTPPALPSFGSASCLGWSADGRTLRTADTSGGRCVWQPPFPLEGKPNRLTRWLETRTGQALDDEGVPHPLDAKAWQERRQRLQEEPP